MLRAYLSIFKEASTECSQRVGKNKKNKNKKVGTPTRLF